MRPGFSKLHHSLPFTVDLALLVALGEQVLFKGESVIVLSAAVTIFFLYWISSFFLLRDSTGSLEVHRIYKSKFFLFTATVLLLVTLVVASHEGSYIWLRGNDPLRTPAVEFVTGAIFCALLYYSIRERRKFQMFISAIAVFVVAVTALTSLHIYSLSASLYSAPSVKLLFLLIVLFIRVMSGTFGDLKETYFTRLVSKLESIVLLAVGGAVLVLFFWALFIVKSSPLDRTPPQYRVTTQFIGQLLVSEDPLYWEHRGVDFKRMRDVIRETILSGEYGRGGSTLAMQLAKIRYLTYEKTLVRKIRQIVIGVILELLYTKEEILWSYINTVSFGGDALGLETAALYYFNTTPAALTSEQCRLLVLTIPDPGRYNPKMNNIHTRTRLIGYVIAARYREYIPRLGSSIRELSFVKN